MVLPVVATSSGRESSSFIQTRQAGLFHTAFLMPTRADLARWVVHASESRLPVDGMADHLVSEAFYLTDPEGNGVEIYSDRPTEEWAWEGAHVRMATDPLDVNAIVASLGEHPGRWSGARLRSPFKNR